MIYFGAKHPLEISDTTNEYLVVWGPERNMCEGRREIRTRFNGTADQGRLVEIASNYVLFH